MKKIYFNLLLLLISGAVVAQVDRSKMPEPGPAPKIDLGETQSFTMDNGMKVFVVENHKLPRVAFAIQLDIDPILEGDKVGAADIAGDLLAKGTSNMSKDDLNFAVDFIGASFSTSAGSIFGSSLKKHQTKLLEIMSDVVKNAEFKQEELDKLKTQYISGIQTEKDDPDAIARNVRRVMLYGKDHPYGEIMTEETVNNITLDDTKNYYKTYFRPNVAYMAIVGDIDLKEAKELANKYFGDWQKGDVPTHEYKMPKKPSGMQVVFVNKPGAVQSVIAVSNTIDLKPGSENSIKARITNGILGGGFVSKLNLNLREAHSYTYGARSSISSDELVGNFNASAKVRNEVTDSALTETMKELMAMRNGDITEDELKTIKNYFTGTFAIGLENPQTKARYAINIDRYQLADDYYTTYLEKVAAVSLEDVKNISNAYITPNSGYMIVVGNQEEVAEKIKKFSANGEIMFRDSYGNEVKETTMKPAPEGVTAESVINGYIDAIGGAKAIGKLKAVRMNMSTTAQGMAINMEVISQRPNSISSSMMMNGMTVQKQVFNGTEGQTTGMQGNKMIEGEELEKLKEESTFMPEMQYLGTTYKTELVGVDRRNDEDVYVLKITKPSGNVMTNYYSTTTALLVSSEEMVEQGGQSYMTDVTYTEYQEQKGLKFPKKMIRNEGPMTLDITVDELEVNPKLDSETFAIQK